MADTNEFKPRPCHHCGAAHGHFTDCLHKYERAIATASDLGGLWALCNYFALLTATPPADAALADDVVLPNHEPTIAIGEILDGYDDDDRDDVWESIQAYADVHARAALEAAALRARAVPDGFVMVPVEPTDAMFRAANKYELQCAIQNYGGCADASGIWEAMLAASKGGAT